MRIDTAERLNECGCAKCIVCGFQVVGQGIRGTMKVAGAKMTAYYCIGCAKLAASVEPAIAAVLDEPPAPRDKKGGCKTAPLRPAVT